MQTLPLPWMVGGTHVTTDRVSGPPSKMLPALRDLNAATATLQKRVIDQSAPVGETVEVRLRITIEIDTAKSRKQGVIRPSANLSNEQLYLSYPISRYDQARRASVGYPLSEIIAFRVLGIEVENET